MTAILINNDRKTIVTRYRDPDERWDGDDTSSVNNITGIEIVKKNQYYDLLVPYKVVADKTYYLVYVEYSTGDSFSTTSGAIEYVEMFEDEEDAIALALFLRADYESKEPCDFKPVTFTDKKGNDYVIYTGSWRSYFERVDEDGFVVKPVRIESEMRF